MKTVFSSPLPPARLLSSSSKLRRKRGVIYCPLSLTQTLNKDLVNARVEGEKPFPTSLQQETGNCYWQGSQGKRVTLALVIRPFLGTAGEAGNKGIGFLTQVPPQVLKAGIKAWYTLFINVES